MLSTNAAKPEGIAEEESQTISRWTKAALKSAKTRGAWPTIGLVQRWVSLQADHALTFKPDHSVGAGQDNLLQAKWDKRAATKFLRRMIKRTASVPTEIVSDRRRPTAAAIQDILPTAKHVRGKGFNNRAENSHQPTRQRERKAHPRREGSPAEHTVSQQRRVQKNVKQWKVSSMRSSVRRTSARSGDPICPRSPTQIVGVFHECDDAVPQVIVCDLVEADEA